MAPVTVVLAPGAGLPRSPNDREGDRGLGVRLIPTPPGTILRWEILRVKGLALNVGELRAGPCVVRGRDVFFTVIRTTIVSLTRALVGDMSTPVIIASAGSIGD